MMQSLNAAIASNPIGWIIAGTAAFLALGNAIFGANQKMEEMSDTAQKEADAWKQKNNDIDERINRLQELSQYENLTNQENAEMELLLNQLQKAGVNVNEMFDEQSGKLKKTADGFQNAKKSAKEYQIELLKAANAEAQKNMDAAQKNIGKLGEYHMFSFKFKSTKIKEMEEQQAEFNKYAEQRRKNFEEIAVLESQIVEETERDKKIQAQRKKEEGILKESAGLEGSVQSMEKGRAEKGLSDVQKKMNEVQKEIDAIDNAKFEGKLSEQLEARRNELTSLLTRLQAIQEADAEAEKAAEKAKEESKTVSDSTSLSSSVQSMKRAQEEKGLNEYQKKMKEIREQLEKIQETAQKGGMTEELTNAQNQLYEDLRLLEEMEEEYEKNEAAAKAAKDATEAKRKADEEAAKKEQERQQSLQRIRDLTKQLEDASLSSSQKELKALKDINEELKKRLETTQGLTAEEKAAAQKALADNEKRQNEFVQNRLDPAQAQYNLEMDHLQENLAREREEYLQALEKAKYDESNKDVQTAKKEMEQAEDAIRQQTLTGAQKEQEKAQEEYTEKLSNLNNALTDEDRLKATDEMEAARERLKNATERVYSLKNDEAQKKILAAGKKEQKEMAQMESRGTFSAYGLDSMVSSIPQQQLDYTKRIAMFVQSIFQGQQAEGVTV